MIAIAIFIVIVFLLAFVIVIMFTITTGDDRDRDGGTARCRAHRGQGRIRRPLPRIEGRAVHETMPWGRAQIVLSGNPDDPALDLVRDLCGAGEGRDRWVPHLGSSRFVELASALYRLGCTGPTFDIADSRGCPIDDEDASKALVDTIASRGEGAGQSLLNSDLRDRLVLGIRANSDGGPPVAIGRLGVVHTPGLRAVEQLLRRAWPAAGR